MSDTPRVRRLPEQLAASKVAVPVVPVLVVAGKAAARPNATNVVFYTPAERAQRKAAREQARAQGKTVERHGRVLRVVERGKE